MLFVRQSPMEKIVRFPDVFPNFARFAASQMRVGVSTAPRGHACNVCGAPRSADFSPQESLLAK
jgi:hypothetical protein